MTESSENATTKLAHVLFMDIVGYSKLPIDQQTRVSDALKEIVRGTKEVSSSPSEDQLISLSTGDGLALVFFTTPVAPVKCAAEISLELKKRPEVQLRMGIHSGLVQLIWDINDKLNVAGGGINTAQRVMDCADHGHILVSKRVADDLKEYTRWEPLLHDLGEVKVKHDVSVHIFNLYSDEIGNPAEPGKLKRRRRAVSRAVALVLTAILLLGGVGLFAWYVMPKSKDVKSGPQRPDSDFQALLDRKKNAWVAGVFLAQAPNGGIKTTPSSEDNTVQVWPTAQCLVGVFEAQSYLDNYVPKIKKGFNYIESTRRTDPSGGWNLYGGKDPYTITEVGGWVTVAYIKSIESKTAIWTDAEKPAIADRILRDLDELKLRQDENGGFRPIIDDHPGFTRTYPTIVALWGFLEARRSPALSERVGTQFDETIRKGINWLLRTYKEKQGWLQNPNRPGQANRFDGLTAQTLLILSIADGLQPFDSFKTDPVYSLAKNEFVANKQFADWSIEKDNSSIPDGDLRFPDTDYLGEGSTFLWFPWTLAELTQLSGDKSLSQTTRDDAAKLRLEILNANFDRLENYVETVDFTYLLGENLYCVSFYLNNSRRAG